MSDLQKPLINPVITGKPDFQPGRQKTQTTVRTAGKSFGELLRQSIGQAQTQTRQLTFSRHAQTRTEQRGIELTENDLDRLSAAVGKAGDKGLTDTLVFMNNTAFIVNVPSRVVITVVDGGETDGNVFTNIDGAVIL